jgi:AcrR family transcriptional regulator
MVKQKTNVTKIAVMNAAERLFAARGFEATSLRAITAEAGANLGAVNYHFTSKDALILAVFKRRMKPLNVERLALLRKFQDEAGEKPVAVPKILEALFRPALEALTKPSKGGRYFLRLLALVLAEPGAYLLPLIKEEFAQTAERFHEELRRALPDSSSEEIYWKFHFAMGAFVHTVAQSRVLELSSHGRCHLTGTSDTLERLTGFCAGGFQAKSDIIKERRKP